MRSLVEINQLLAEAEETLATLNVLQEKLLSQIAKLQQEKASFFYRQAIPLPPGEPPLVANQSPPEVKIALFRSLFRGRQDVYPKRFEDLKTGKTGYQPACRNEWGSGIWESRRRRDDHVSFCQFTDES